MVVVVVVDDDCNAIKMETETEFCWASRPQINSANLGILVRYDLAVDRTSENQQQIAVPSYEIRQQAGQNEQVAYWSF